MGKKIKLNKGAYVNEEGYIVNPEIPKKQRPSLQKSQPVKGEPLTTVAPKGKPIEDYKPETIGDTLTAMHEASVMSAGRAKGDGINVKVSPVVYARDIDETCRYFVIEYASKGYTVYQIASEIYFRETSEFDQIVGEIKDGVPGKTGLSLCYQYKNPSEPMQSYNVRQREDCFFIIASIFSSLTGNSYSETKHTVDEKNCVIIKRTKIGTDGLVKNSLRFKEAKEGTPEENRFKQEIEDKQKQEPSVVGCLDQQPEEGAKIIKHSEDNDLSDAEQPRKKSPLPNAKHVSESAVVTYDEIEGLQWNGNDYIWEPGDQVFVRIWKSSDKRKKDFSIFRGRVIGAQDGVSENDPQEVTVLIHGGTYIIDPSDIAPDVTIEVQHNRFEQSIPGLVDRAAANGAGIHDGESKEEYLDHNRDRYLYGDIVYAGNRLTFAPVRINLKDITESKHDIRVINENEVPVIVPIDNLSVDVENWPWAIVVDSDNPDEDKRDEPLRKIKVNPVDFVNANAESDGEDGFVQCVINDRETKMLKKHIKIIS